MNKVFLIGNVCSGVDDKATSNGTAHARFRLAVGRRFKDADGNYPTDFFQIETWRKTAEYAVKYVGKGDKVAIAGAVQNREYTTKEGEKRQVTEIIADEVEKLSRTERTDEQPSGDVPQGFTQVEDDDSLPF